MMTDKCECNCIQLQWHGALLMAAAVGAIIGYAVANTISRTSGRSKTKCSDQLDDNNSNAIIQQQQCYEKMKGSIVDWADDNSTNDANSAILEKDSKIIFQTLSLFQQHWTNLLDNRSCTGSTNNENNIHDNNELKVVEYKTPSQLEAIIKAASDKCDDTGSGMMRVLEAIVKHSVCTQHKFFLNQLFGPCDPVCIAADLVLCLTNTSAYTYEMAPALTLIEHDVIRTLSELVGWQSVSSFILQHGDDFMSKRFSAVLDDLFIFLTGRIPVACNFFFCREMDYSCLEVSARR